MNTNRRKFLQNASQIAAGLGFASIPGSIIASNVSDEMTIPEKNPPAELIRIGLIGCNSMGWADLSSTLTHSGVECVALCDIDNNVLNRRAADLEKKTGKRAALYGDYRKLLENKDIDAVIIGTPDHWHCLQMIHSCEAGKDVYVEKPIANTIEECNLMVAAKNRYNKVVQVGQWQRSDPHWISALNYLRSGKLGKIRTAKTWAYVSYGRNFLPKPDQPAPAGVDYDMWLGPAPKRQFNPNRFHGSFRYFWDYAGGLMTDWGVHMIDMVLGGMNVTAPISVAAIGGKYGFPDSAAETPDTMQVVYDFGNFSMLWDQALGTGREPYNRNAGQPGVAFIGNNGTLVIDRDKWEVYPEADSDTFLMESIPAHVQKLNGLDFHTQNFLDCIKSRQQPNCSIEMGRNAAVNAQLGNIAYKSGGKLFWDEKKNVIINDLKAEDMAKARYRAPWKLPTL
ncbi:MAG: Gfo/Idh/MocA family oxidoreductase [Chitinophagaceae bacterium]